MRAFAFVFAAPFSPRAWPTTVGGCSV